VYNNNKLSLDPPSIAIAATRHALEAHGGHSPRDPERRGRRRQEEDGDTEREKTHP